MRACLTSRASVNNLLRTGIPNQYFHSETQPYQDTKVINLWALHFTIWYYFQLIIKSRGGRSFEYLVWTKCSRTMTLSAMEVEKWSNKKYKNFHMILILSISSGFVAPTFISSNTWYANYFLRWPIAIDAGVYKFFFTN